MPTEDPNVPIALPPGSGISFSQRLFSDEVGLAEEMGGQSLDLDRREVTYEFSGCRRFLSVS